MSYLIDKTMSIKQLEMSYLIDIFFFNIFIFKFQKDFYVARFNFSEVNSFHSQRCTKWVYMPMIIPIFLKEIILRASSLKWTILGIPTQPHQEKSKLAKNFHSNQKSFKNGPTCGTPTKSFPKKISYTFLKKKNFGGPFERTAQHFFVFSKTRFS